MIKPKIVLQGEISLNERDMSAELEFVEDKYGNKGIVLHLPENSNTSNWYHCVTIKTDLPEQ